MFIQINVILRDTLFQFKKTLDFYNIQISFSP